MLQSLNFNLSLPASQAVGDTTWVWLIPLVFVVFLLFGIWTRSQGRGLVKTERVLASAAVEVKSQPRPRQPAQPLAQPPATEVEPVVQKLDDLVIIEGIGPKIAGVLKLAGISSFAELALVAPERISQILKESGLRVPADPTTWPEQAALAAAGRWEELQRLQANLKGGRKV